jgi:hypothetical protein
MRGHPVDLEHEIELAPLNRVELRKRAEMMRDTRRRRREARTRWTR